MNFNDKLDIIFEKKGKELSPKDKGYFDSCVKKNDDKDNPEAYCAAIKDKAWKSDMWRGKDKTKKQTEKDVAEDLKEGEILKGGLADDKSVEDLAKRHNVSVDFIADQLKKGIKVEMEHTGDKRVALEVALDHIFEDEKYYIKLEKMEKE
jgi:hypothetical protein